MPRSVWVVAAAVAAAFAVGSCLGGDSDRVSSPSSSSTTAPPPPPEIKVTVAAAGVESMAGPVEFPAPLKDAVAAAVNRWLDVGVVAPLRTGQPPGGLEAAFSPIALARLTPGSPDRAALLEEGAGGAVEPETASLSLVGLADQGGAVGLVTGSVEVSFLLVNGADRVRVRRVGEVTLVPFGDAWLIDGYDVVATRDTVVPAPPAQP